ncbi:MAG TPA: TolC family protein, partial [Phycisphaerales bacterium]|nr:TolC family protein [Phycisphaerales bacterium]
MVGGWFKDMVRRRVCGSAVVGALGGVIGLAGCQSPLGDDLKQSETLRNAVERMVAEETRPNSQTDRQPNMGEEEAETRGEEGTSGGRGSAVDSEVAQLVEKRGRELEGIGPALDWRKTHVGVGVGLDGSEEHRVGVPLSEAIQQCVERNLDVKQAQLARGISEEEITRAQAAFDLVLFGNVDLEKSDEPAVVPVLGGIPLAAPINAEERYRFETGMRKRLTLGSEVHVSTDVTRLQTNTPGFQLFPDPAYTAGVRMGISQPLMRGFGRDVNEAEIQLAKSASQRAGLELEMRLEQAVRDTEWAYWDLRSAWEELVISNWLVKEAELTRDVLSKRREIDVDDAEYADAISHVEQRRTDVIRAQEAVRSASDKLKLLMNAQGMGIVSEVVIEPTDDPEAAGLACDLADAITEAVRKRPEVARAGLLIDDEDIRRKVAENRLLPVLDVRGEAAILGMDDSFGGGYGEVGDGRFIDYIAGLAFEMPLGNREAEAEVRAQRLRGLGA